MKAFWNNEEGLTLQEFVAVVVMLMWVLVTGVILYNMIYHEITQAMIDFYSVLGWMPLGVIGGLFGERAFANLGSYKGGKSNAENGQQGYTGH